MKGFLKFLGWMLFVPYIIIVVIVTVCLLNYNEYGVTEIGAYTLITVENSELEPAFKNGDLLIVEKSDNSSIKKGDDIFFYEKDIEKKTVIINLAEVLAVREITTSESTYTIEGDYEYSSEYVIGSTKDTRVFHDLGAILSLLESKWVFLLVIILPVLFIFLYELYEFVLEVKRSLKEDV